MMFEYEYPQKYATKRLTGVVEYQKLYQYTVDKQHHISVAIFVLFTNNYWVYSLNAYISILHLRLE